MFKNSTLLITGGTGSFGENFINHIIKKKINFKKIIIFSRDEFKQSLLETKIPKNLRKKFRFLLGDIRDLNRLKFAFQGVEYVIHAAALKQVPKAEYNPFEYIKTNVMGAQNVVEAAISNNVKKVVALSTDKASSPINLYGATKLCSDKIFTSANNIKGKRKIIFSVVRYGNVFGSRGSVVPFFLSIKNNIFPITHSDMTRFNINLDEAIDLVLWTFKNSYGGDVIVPKIPSYRLLDLAKAINNKAKFSIVGIRPGEKIHEEMISANESRNAIMLKDKYVIISEFNFSESKKYYLKFKGSKLNKEIFAYSSNQKKYLNNQSLKKLVFNFKKSK
jgi:UDP-N-acetylglucosamine 4,6-dehydratase/5-epimerase